MMAATFLESLPQRDGGIDPSPLAKALGISKRRLAVAIGLPADAIYRKSRIYSGATQERLRDFAAFMDLVVTWHETPPAAFNWFCWHPLFPFAGRTAEEVFKSEGVGALKIWAGQVDAGVYV